jgi:hypothetical protein
MHTTETITARLRAAPGLPELLAAAFDAFEAIRLLARGSEGEVPALFAAFMTAADAAVDGREAITAAPSLAPTHAGAPPGNGAGGGRAAGDTAGQVSSALAALAEVLGTHLTAAASRAFLPGDRAACQQAAVAARQIHLVMASDGDDGRLR